MVGAVARASITLSAVALLGLGLAGVARADGPACKTFDRSPPCCPHPPPQCCPAPVAGPLDDETVAQVCGAQAPKGQTSSLNTCKRYFVRGEAIAEVAFGRELGDAKAFDKLRADLAGPRALASAATVAGAARAFVLREVDETGAPQRASAWALVGAEILHVQAERGACDDEQVQRLLARAVERVARPATTARR